jgi:hypothetical protein
MMFYDFGHCMVGASHVGHGPATSRQLCDIFLSVTRRFLQNKLIMVLKVGRFFTHYRLQYFRNCPNPILRPMSPERRRRNAPKRHPRLQ